MIAWREEKLYSLFSSWSMYITYNHVSRKRIEKDIDLVWYQKYCVWTVKLKFFRLILMICPYYDMDIRMWGETKAYWKYMFKANRISFLSSSKSYKYYDKTPKTKTITYSLCDNIIRKNNAYLKFNFT